MSATQVLQRPTESWRWTVNSKGTSVDFTVKTFWGLSIVRGRFHRFDGSYEDGPDGATIEMTIEADSLDTGHGKRDAHLRSSDFFGVAEHPHVRFTSTRVHDVADGILHVVGKLEAGGNVVDIEFPAAVQAAGQDLEIEATTTVDQRRLGMRGKLGMIRPPATLHVKARLSR